MFKIRHTLHCNNAWLVNIYLTQSNKANWMTCLLELGEIILQTSAQRESLVVIKRGPELMRGEVRNRKWRGGEYCNDGGQIEYSHRV